MPKARWGLRLRVSGSVFTSMAMLCIMLGTH